MSAPATVMTVEGQAEDHWKEYEALELKERVDDR